MMVECTRPDELIILAMGSSRWECPFDGAHVWSCNNGYHQIAEMKGYLEKVFMSHEQHSKWRDVEGKAELKLEYNLPQLNMLSEHHIEVYNIHKVKGLKSKLYPLKRISDKFEANGFFSNTISYMIAFALDMSTKKVDGKLVLNGKGFKKIRFYGVDMLTSDEYNLEKGGLEYWIGYAKGLGIKIEITDVSAVCKTQTGKPYGIKCYKLKEVDPYGLLKIKRFSRKGQELREYRFKKRLSKEQLVQLVDTGKID